MKEVLTTFEIKNLLSIDITTAMKWIDSGKMKGYTTPGGHRRVLKQDFLNFLKKYKMPMMKK